MSEETRERFKAVLLSNEPELSKLEMVCEKEPELRTGSFVMMFTVPAMAEEPNKAEPPPRTTYTRSIILAGICSSPYTPAKEEKMGRESINIWVYFPSRPLMRTCE